MIRNKLCISFSGGETSAAMTQMILEDPPEQYRDIVVVFANTGQENEETLEFVDKCDKYFNFNVVWVEALVTHTNGVGTGHRIVNFETASRNGEPFEEVIKKYGIPNQAYPICTRELKLHAIRSYCRSLGWKACEYDSAVGIRMDEIDRVSSYSIKRFNVVYPLIEWYKFYKRDIREFWENQPFRLNLQEHMGNCKWCWKKSLRKLLTLANDYPEYFDFPYIMEELYGNIKTDDRKRVFFRKNMNTKQLLELSKLPFDRFTDEYRVSIANFNEELDSAGGCSESCEIY